MKLFLERLILIWVGITLAGLVIAALYWAIKIVVYIAFISLFIAIVVTAFYHFYWSEKNR